MHQPIEPIPNAGQDIQKQAPVGIIEKDRLAPVSAIAHMVQRTGKLEATLKNCHPGNFSRREAKMRFPLRFIFSRLDD